MKDISVGMYRPHMRDIPEHELPAGYSFRPYKIGDSDPWVHVQRTANIGIGEVTRQTWVNDFSEQEELMPERSWFVLDPEGKDVASITAWWRGDTDPHQGLIHWVAVLPECQGKGMGKAIMTRAMLWLAEQYDDAYLGTCTLRIPAIKVYLDFGFEPDMTRDDAEEAWGLIRGVLKHPALGNA
jgi:GNAT superfamily N-acetyltransferase